MYGQRGVSWLELLSRIWYRTDLRHELVSGENGQKFLRAGRPVLGIPPGAQVLLLVPADPTVVDVSPPCGSSRGSPLGTGTSIL